MWEDLELDPERIPLFKLIFHGAQILFAFVLWCLEITVFRTKGAKIVGNNGWTFAAFFLSVPAWIYLLMAPRFPRTRRLAEPHAMLVVDALFAVVWLSAFATQAAYNTANLCGPVCNLSKAIVGLGFFVFLFFCITTFLSIWTLKYYQWNNRLPGYDSAQHSAHPQNIDPDKAAFSLAPHDEEAYAPVNMSDRDDTDHDSLHYGGHGGGAGARSDYSDPYGGSHVGGTASTVSGGGYTDNPFRQHETASGVGGANPFDSDTEYHSGGGSHIGGSMASRYTATPSATDIYGGHDDQAASFPQGNYDRITR